MRAIAPVFAAAMLLTGCQSSPSKDASLTDRVIGPAPEAVATPMHCPAPGTVMARSNGQVVRFGSADGVVCHITVNERGIRTAHGLWSDYEDANVEQIQRAEHARETLETLSLQVGRRVDFTTYAIRDCLGCGWSNTYTVERAERIQVAAGTFDTFVIRWHQENATWERDTWFWYAPALGAPVMQRGTLVRGDGRAMSSWEAKEIIAAE